MNIKNILNGFRMVEGPGSAITLDLRVHGSECIVSVNEIRNGVIVPTVIDGTISIYYDSKDFLLPVDLILKFPMPYLVDIQNLLKAKADNYDFTTDYNYTNELENDPMFMAIDGTKPEPKSNEEIIADMVETVYNAGKLIIDFEPKIQVVVGGGYSRHQFETDEIIHLETSYYRVTVHSMKAVDPAIIEEMNYEISDLPLTLSIKLKEETPNFFNTFDDDDEIEED